ncbi:MAG: ArsR/SmtB family transcription factor [Halobacteriales archaeon]
MTEFEAEVTVDDIVVRDTRTSSAVDEPIRAMILDMLAEEAMTAGEVHRELADRGIERTENTVRHHVNELRDAGLVEVARLEEGRGGTRKYYEANTIVLSYALPDGAEDAVERMAGAVEPLVDEAVGRLRAEFGGELADLASQMAPCAHCANQKYETYLLLTVLRRAFVRAETGG